MAKTILIVDDSNTARASVEYTLKKGSYDVISADDGTTGLEAVNKASNIDMIITDLNMPKMDGIEFIKNVRKFDKYKYTPILMLTILLYLCLQPNLKMIRRWKVRQQGLAVG